MNSYKSLFAGILATVIVMAFYMTAIAQTSGVDITSKERIFERNSQIAYFKNNGPQLTNECANRIEPANWANRTDIITYVWSGGNGYIFGTNLYGDSASAQYFEPDGSVTLSGAEYTIGAKLGSTGTVVFGVWDFASKDLLTSVEVNFADIEDELDETPTAYYVEFDNPVEVSGPYLLGYDISGLGGFNPDSYFVGLSSSVVGDAGGANTAYNLEASGQWVPQGNYGVDVEIAVFGCSLGNPDPTISLNPLELNFRVTEGSYDSELFTVRNNGLQTLTVDLAPSFNGTVLSFDSSVEYQRYLDRQSSNGSLSPVSEEFMPHLLTDDELTISQTSLSLEPFESAVLVVTANAAALSAGSYPASISITSNDPANGSINYPVGFTVVEPVSVIWEQFATSGNGIVSAFFDTTGTGQGAGAFSSDDFEIVANTSIEQITTRGFFAGSSDLGSVSSLTWEIYPDDNGKPAGNPETNPSAAIWSLTKLTRASGIVDDDGTITVDLLSGGGSAVELTPGKYWYVFYTTQQSAVGSGDRWNWFAGETNLNTAKIITPTDAFGGAFADWTDLTAVDQVFSGLSFRMVGEIEGVEPPTPPGPIAVINTPELDYGAIVNSTTSTLNLIIENSGSSNLIVESITSDSENFEVSFTGPASLAPREVAAVQVKFIPNAVGLFEGSLNIETNSSIDPIQTASLVGTANDIPVFLSNPDSISVNLGEGYTGNFQFTITNEGMGPLEFFMPDFFVETQMNHDEPMVQSIENREVSKSGLTDITERTILQRYHDGTLVNPTEEELAIIEGYQSLRSDNNTTSGAELSDISWTLNFNISIEGWFFQRQNFDDYVGTLTGVNGDFVGVGLPQGTFTNDLTVLIIDGPDLAVAGILAQIGGTGPVADHTGEYQPWGCGDFDDPVNCGVTLNTPIEMGADKYIWIGNGYSESPEATWQGTLVFDGITGPIDFLSGVSPANGVVEPGQSTTVTVSLNPGTAPLGVYENLLAISTNVPNLPNFTTTYQLPVTLTIDDSSGGGDAMVQIIHNSPDPAVASVDVYLGDELVLEDFNFRNATPFLELPAGIELEVTLTPNGLSLEEGVRIPLTLENGKNYYAIATGVLDPDMFASSPTSSDISFRLEVVENAELSSEAENFRAIMMHGSTDAPAVDMYLQGVEEPIMENAVFGDITEYLTFSENEIYNLDLHVSDQYFTTYQLDTSDLGGKTAFVMASGFVAPEANQDGEEFALFVALSDGSIVLLDSFPSSINDNSTPLSYSLAQNYPNPFNPTTTINYSLPYTSDVTLEVINMLGQKVASLTNTRQVAGSYSVEFDASNLSSGIYLYRLQAGNFVQTRKLTLIK